MELNFLVYLLIGELFVYLGMHFPPLSESTISLIRRIWTCSLCSGVWVFTFLSFVMKVVMFREVFYFPVISELATGGLIAFVAHLVELGWKSKFEVIIIE